MAKREPSIVTQTIASDGRWRLTCNTAIRTGHTTYFLRKLVTDKGQDSAFIQSYTDEGEAFAACEQRGLTIKVRKDMPSKSTGEQA